MQFFLNRSQRWFRQSRVPGLLFDPVTNQSEINCNRNNWTQVSKGKDNQLNSSYKFFNDISQAALFSQRMGFEKVAGKTFCASTQENIQIKILSKKTREDEPKCNIWNFQYLPGYSCFSYFGFEIRWIHLIAELDKFFMDTGIYWWFSDPSIEISWIHLTSY